MRQNVALVTIGTLVGILDLGLIYGAVWYGKNNGSPQQKRGGLDMLQSNSDPSPIIITDGSSIHFSQRDQWLYESDTTIAAQLPNHTVSAVKVGLCTPNASTAVGICTELINQSVIGTSWNLYLCGTSTCDGSAGSYAAMVSSDDDTEVVINATSSFIVEPKLKKNDGPSFKLASVNLKYAAIQLGTAAVQPPVDCSATNPPNKPCVVRICYANTHAAACR